MDIKSFVFNPFYENTYVLSDDSKSCIIIDPGCYENYEVEELLGYIGSENLKVEAIVNTHCHIDHVLGNDRLKDHFNCPLKVPEGEVDLYRAVESYAPNYGFQHFRYCEPDELIPSEGYLSFGKTRLDILYVPGHSPGHLMFHHVSTREIVGGDVLFRESIGRTDLPGGNHDQLLTNIQLKLYTLDPEITVFPGHGPSTTIAHERANNPFVKA